MREEKQKYDKSAYFYSHMEGDMEEDEVEILKVW